MLFCCYFRKADLSLCLGTSLQIVPSGNLPLFTKRSGGKLAIVNLQPTKHDKKAHLKINTYVDDVIRGVCAELDIEVPEFQSVSVLLKSVHTLPQEPELNVVLADESLEYKTAVKLEWKWKKEATEESGSVKTRNVKSETGDTEKESVKKENVLEFKVKLEEESAVKQEVSETGSLRNSLSTPLTENLEVKLEKAEESEGDVVTEIKKSQQEHEEDKVVMQSESECHTDNITTFRDSFNTAETGSEVELQHNCNRGHQDISGKLSEGADNSVHKTCSNTGSERADKTFHDSCSEEADNSVHNTCLKGADNSIHNASNDSEGAVNSSSVCGNLKRSTAHEHALIDNVKRPKVETCISINT